MPEEDCARPLWNVYIYIRDTTRESRNGHGTIVWRDTIVGFWNQLDPFHSSLGIIVESVISMAPNNNNNRDIRDNAINYSIFHVV